MVRSELKVVSDPFSPGQLDGGTSSKNVRQQYVAVYCGPTPIKIVEIALNMKDSFDVLYHIIIHWETSVINLVLHYIHLKTKPVILFESAHSLAFFTY